MKISWSFLGFVNSVCPRKIPPWTISAKTADPGFSAESVFSGCSECSTLSAFVDESIKCDFQRSVFPGLFVFGGYGMAEGYPTSRGCRNASIDGD
jgi:hypothetical protein